MSSPTPPDPPTDRRAASARSIKPVVWILAAIGLLLLSATLAIALLADRTVRKAGLAFRFDAAKKTLVLFGADGNEVKPSAIGDGGHALDAADQKVLVTWLAQHLEYRAAVDSDCACDEALRLNPGALPYTAASDFNHDGKKDFASGDQQENRKVRASHFQWADRRHSTSIIPQRPGSSTTGLVFRSAIRNLYYGYYNSDDLWRFIWSRNKYGLEYALPDHCVPTSYSWFSVAVAEGSNRQRYRWADGRMRDLGRDQGTVAGQSELRKNPAGRSRSCSRSEPRLWGFACGKLGIHPDAASPNRELVGCSSRDTAFE